MGQGALGAGTKRFQHHALFYQGQDEFVSATLPFIQEGLERGEPVLVAVLPDRIRRLRSALQRDADRVRFLDMAEVGGNPGRIIPVWQHFMHEHTDRWPGRGVGEPVWSGRRDVELDECRLHEALINVAFDDGPPWRLMCPYDAETLPSAVLEEAVQTHRGDHRYAEDSFASPLPPPPSSARRVSFREDALTRLRRTVRAWAQEAGLSETRAHNLVLATHELATNSVAHGGGSGVLQAWTERGTFVVDICDRGAIGNPLVGRDLVADRTEGGRGVWLAHQLCDLLQLRSSPSGTNARLHFWI